MQGYLISQRPIDSLILRRTAPIDVFYTDEAYSINNATIKIIEGNKIIELKNDRDDTDIISMPIRITK